MKKLFNLNNIAALLLLCITITSCEKDKDDPAPDLATKVAGIYVFSELEFNGQTVPADKSDLKGDIRIVRKTATTIDAELDIRSKSSGDDFMVYDVSDIELSEDGSTIELIYENEIVARIKGKKISVNGTDDVGVDFTLSATR